MAPISKLGRGRPLKSQTREVIHRLYRYFETEIERDPNSTVTAAQLVTHSTGVSNNAIKRVLTEFQTKEHIILRGGTPLLANGNLLHLLCQDFNTNIRTRLFQTNSAVKKEYKPPKKRCRKNISEDAEAQAIRRIIHSYYTKDDEFPVMKDLYLILKADIDYQGSLYSLRRHVAKLGFKSMEKEDNNRVLIEKHEVRYARVQYLTRIEAYRLQGRNIVYTGEATIESSRISSKPKADGSSTMLKQPAKDRQVILLAGDQNEIIRNTLFIYEVSKREMKEEAECKRESFEQHEKWLKSHLIPALKPNSVIIVDASSPYHNRIYNPTPHSHSKKKEIMEYLSSRNIPYSREMYKSQLYQLVLLNKDRHLEYKTDQFLREHGHTVLRLPINYPELNPIKKLLTSVKNYVEAGKNYSLKPESVIKIAREKIQSLSKDDWMEANKATEAEENNLKAIDKVVDEISENAFKFSDDESGESEDDEVSDQESMDSD